MNSVEQPNVESEAISDFARVMQPVTDPLYRSSSERGAQAGRLNLDHDDVKNGLGQLVLTLVKLLHELLERRDDRRPHRRRRTGAVGRDLRMGR